MLGLTSVETKLLFKAAVALILFTSSVIAEIIRGGLNSVAAGQFEAGHSQGFSTVQIMIYIVLPQAFRSVVPTLLSQVITTVKDSSYLANVATIELMSRVKKILSSANMYNGTGNINVSDVFVLFGCAAIIYFIINFSISCVVRSMQKNNKKNNRIQVSNINMEC
jgi:putative glutamine transport system permease protein